MSAQPSELFPVPEIYEAATPPELSLVHGEFTDYVLEQAVTLDLEPAVDAQTKSSSEGVWNPYRHQARSKPSRGQTIRVTPGAPSRGGNSVPEVDPNSFYEQSEVTIPTQRTSAEQEDEGPLDWQSKALCTQTDPYAFFPEKGEDQTFAKKICEHCEVKMECLEYALATNVQFGIAGGLNQRERRRMLRQVG